MKKINMILCAALLLNIFTFNASAATYINERETGIEEEIICRVISNDTGEIVDAEIISSENITIQPRTVDGTYTSINTVNIAIPTAANTGLTSSDQRQDEYRIVTATLTYHYNKTSDNGYLITDCSISNSSNSSNVTVRGGKLRAINTGAANNTQDKQVSYYGTSGNMITGFVTPSYNIAPVVVAVSSTSNVFETTTTNSWTIDMELVRFNSGAVDISPR